MITLSELKNKIVQSSNINELNNLISLRAFLLEQEQCPWFVIEDISSLSKVIEEFEKHQNIYYKNKNTNNIKKFNITPLELYLLPKNKKLIILSLLNEIIEDLSQNSFIIEDLIRINPFNKDTLLELINSNNNLPSDIITKYNKRSQDLTKILEIAEVEKTIYSNCIYTAKKNKIIEYWRQKWGDNKNYHPDAENIINYVVV